MDNATITERLGNYRLYQNGFLTDPHVVVLAYADDTISVGNTLHRKDELTISEDGDRITGQGNWELVRKSK